MLAGPGRRRPSRSCGILLANGQALTTLVWAEDGLFPLCVRAHGLLACASRPLLRLPAPPAAARRVAGQPGAPRPVAAGDQPRGGRCWPGRRPCSPCSSCAPPGPASSPPAWSRCSPSWRRSWASRRSTPPAAATCSWCSWPRSPCASRPRAGSRRGRTPSVPLVVALTIPSSALLLLPLGVQLLRRRIPRRGGLVVGALLVAGLAVQAFVARHGRQPATDGLEPRRGPQLGRHAAERPDHLLARPTPR